MPVAPVIIGGALGAAGSIYSANQSKKASQQAANASQQATDRAIAEQRRQYDLSRADLAPYRQAGTGALGILSQIYGISAQPQSAQPGMTQNGQPVLTSGRGILGRLDNAGIDTSGVNLPTTLPTQTQPPAGSGTGTNPTSPDYSSFFASPDYQFRLDESMRALNARNAALGIQDSGAAQKAALSQAGNLASGEFGNFWNRLAGLAGIGQTATQQQAQLGQNFANNFGNLQLGNAQNLASSYQQRAAANGALGQNLAGIGSGLIGNLWPTGGGGSFGPGGSLYGLY